jgi:uncharacterized protein (TIGR02391 family)
MDQPQNIEITNPNRAWVIGQFEKLYVEWVTWQKEVEAIVDKPYDRNTHSEVFADGEDMMLRHDALQAKTLTFLNNNIKGHGFILGFNGRHVDRTDLRLKIRVKHRLHDLEVLKACLEWAKPYGSLDTAQQLIEASGLWLLLHPRVVELAKPRFESGHYADAVESAFKELNAMVKELYIKSGGDELDGVSLMRKAFTPGNPAIRLDDLSTETGRNIQQGYMDLFAGSMSGIRNPKAHSNLNITPQRACHHLALASLLFFKLEERL